MHWYRGLAVFLVASLAASAAQPPAATRVQLLLPVQTVRAGETFVAALELQSKDGWHTYWRNGGDSGAPTTVDWRLPDGVAAGDLQWPPPERFADAGLVTYVYHDTTLLPVPITIAPGTAPGPIEATATVHWLECKESCIPRKAEVRATFTIGDTTQPSSTASRIREARDLIPTPLPEGSATAAWDGPPAGDERTLVITWEAGSGAGSAVPDFFPLSSESFQIATATERLAAAGPTVVLRKKVLKFDGEWPNQVAGLLVKAEDGKRPSVALDAVLNIAASAAAAPPAPTALPGEPTEDSPAEGTATATATTTAITPTPASLTLATALVYAFLGGLILNIMPCVLPVIALKILGFVRQSGSHAAETRRLGLIYGLGVWFSFLVLAGVVIGVKKAAGIAGWGMQFGNPVFLVILTTLILLVALSLFGVFEINLGGGAMDAAGELAGKEGSAGAFFNGMLAVALATPCTAPFLGTALGYAFTADSLTIVGVFSSVALGLASPYVLLTWKPEWLRFLPKPGPWMVRFKIGMGFPMLATALWLYTLASRHFGEAGPLWLGIFLVGISLATWVWGEFAQRGTRHQTAAAVLAVAIAGAAYGGTLENELRWRDLRRASPAPSSNAAAHPASDASLSKDEIPWQPWSRDAVEAARKARKPVFVDFTAEWCLTCQLNERSSINIETVRERLRAIHAVALKGDHTLLPPAITEELQRHGRAGVPLVLVYPKDPSKPPLILPEVLTPGIVLEALEQAAR
ncbi:MAG: protein-disulfide reductase DsbD family protein [Limisphaerales bacterium]